MGLENWKKWRKKEGENEDEGMKGHMNEQTNEPMNRMEMGG